MRQEKNKCNDLNKKGKLKKTLKVIALFLILASFSTMLIFYFICAIIMPDKNDIYQ